MSIEKEFLAEECGLDYDEVMADNNTLSAKDFTYQCAQCAELNGMQEIAELQSLLALKRAELQEPKATKEVA